MCWQECIGKGEESYQLMAKMGGKIVYCERKGNIRVDVRARGRAKKIGASKGRRVCAGWHRRAVVVYGQIDKRPMEAAGQLTR